MDADDLFTDEELEAMTPAERAEAHREMEEVMANGLAPDGSAMHLGDEDLDGLPWQPSPNDL
jgi:hypothetical protein